MAQRPGRPSRSIHADAREILTLAEDDEQMTLKYTPSSRSRVVPAIYKLNEDVEDLKFKLIDPNIVYTVDLNINGFSGNYMGTYDDFRGNSAGINKPQAIDNICSYAGRSRASMGQAMDVDFDCVCPMNEYSTIHCNIGGCVVYPGFGRP